MFSPNPLVKKAVASLWDASCRVYVYRKKTDPETHVSVMEEEEMAGGPFPCLIDVETMPAAENSEGPDTVVQEITLFISPDVNIPAGAKIVYTPPAWNGRGGEVYVNAGVSAVYPLHQEIRLVRKEDHA